MPRILIVDDEPTILNLLNKILIGQGYDATPASNGEKALQLLQTEKFDLIVQDAVYYSPRIDLTDRILKILSLPSK